MKKVTQKNRLAVRERPKETPVMHQDWRDLLFLHWKWDAEQIQKSLPPGLYVDTYEDNAYLTIAPFSLEKVSIGGMPSLPGFSSFLEVNFRTYVYDENGLPGIWFYSLDINSQMAATLARKTFLLPYFHADLHLEKKDNGSRFFGTRLEDATPIIDTTYQNASEESFAEPNSLEFFLIERYVLFTFSANELLLGQVNHKPYPLTSVTVSKWDNRLFQINGFKQPKAKPDAIHYATGVDVDIFALKPLISP